MTSTQRVLIIFCLLSVLLLSVSEAGPLYDVFKSRGKANTNKPSRNVGYAGYPSANNAPQRQRSGRDRFRSICRAHNADAYAFPGRVPYPAANLCPYN